MGGGGGLRGADTGKERAYDPMCPPFVFTPGRLALPRPATLAPQCGIVLCCTVAGAAVYHGAVQCMASRRTGLCGIVVPGAARAVPVAVCSPKAEGNCPKRRPTDDPFWMGGWVSGCSWAIHTHTPVLLKRGEGRQNAQGKEKIVKGRGGMGAHFPKPPSRVDGWPGGLVWCSLDFGKRAGTPPPPATGHRRVYTTGTDRHKAEVQSTSQRE